MTSHNIDYDSADFITNDEKRFLTEPYYVDKLAEHMLDLFETLTKVVKWEKTPYSKTN